MSLRPCRACEHQVDTSALACPSCGATDPAHKISRQSRNLVVKTIQLIVFVAAVVWAASFAWRTYVPMVKEVLMKQQVLPADQAPANSNR